MKTEYPPHPFLTSIPALAGEDLTNLECDIQANGLVQPIVVARGQLVDGRARLSICVKLGIPLRVEQFIGDEEQTVARILGLNLHRRHLTATQKAILGLTLLDYEKAAAERRMKAGRKVNPTHPVGEGPPVGEANEVVGRMVGVSGETIRRAAKVAVNAPELLPDLRAGTLSVRDAERLAAAKPETRARVLETMNSQNLDLHDAARKVGGANLMAVLRSSQSPEWYTPEPFIDLVREVFGCEIDLDPGSCVKANETVRAARIFTLDDDGLGQPWVADTVYTNPDFSLLPRWVPKMIAEFRAGHFKEGILLVPGEFQRRWFAPLHAFPMCLLFRPVNFRPGHRDEASGESPRGTAFVYFGPDFERFREVFSSVGRVLPGDAEAASSLPVPARDDSDFENMPGSDDDPDWFMNMLLEEGAKEAGATPLRQVPQPRSTGILRSADGDAEILLGDCRAVLRGLPDESVDLIVTSPPYAMRRKATYGGVDPDVYAEWFAPCAAELRRVLRPTGSLVLNIKESVVKGKLHPYVRGLVTMMGDYFWRWNEDYIWRKSNSMPGTWPTRFRNGWEHCLHFTRSPRIKMRQEAVKVPIGHWAAGRLKHLGADDLSRRSARTGSGFGTKVAAWGGKDVVLPDNVLELPTECSNRQHPAPFPVALPAWFIRLFTDAGDVVLDPFCGSGSTGVACRQLGRKFIGIDIHADYCRTALRRWNEARASDPSPPSPPETNPTAVTPAAGDLVS